MVKAKEEWKEYRRKIRQGWDKEDIQYPNLRSGATTIALYYQWGQAGLLAWAGKRARQAALRPWAEYPYTGQGGERGLGIDVLQLLEGTRPPVSRRRQIATIIQMRNVLESAGARFGTDIRGHIPRLP